MKSGGEVLRPGRIHLRPHDYYFYAPDINDWRPVLDYDVLDLYERYLTDIREHNYLFLENVNPVIIGIVRKGGEKISAVDYIPKKASASVRAHMIKSLGEKAPHLFNDPNCFSKTKSFLFSWQVILYHYDQLKRLGVDFFARRNEEIVFGGQKLYQEYLVYDHLKWYYQRTTYPLKCLTIGKFECVQKLIALGIRPNIENFHFPMIREFITAELVKSELAKVIPKQCASVIANAAYGNTPDTKFGIIYEPRYVYQWTEEYTKISNQWFFDWLAMKQTLPIRKGELVLAEVRGTRYLREYDDEVDGEYGDEVASGFDNEIDSENVEDEDDEVAKIVKRIRLI